MDENHLIAQPRDPHLDCRQLASTLSRIGDKWTVMVVGVLSDGPIRYTEIRRRIDGISQRMLTLTLRGLEEDGLVSRTLYPSVPPRVEYELTELGRTLIVPLRALFDWVVANRPEILRAKAAYHRKDRDGRD